MSRNMNKFNLDAFEGDSWATAKPTSTTERSDRDVYRLKPGSPIKVRFISDPHQFSTPDQLCVRATADGVWAKYREVAAWADFRTRKNPDGSLSHLHIPVADFDNETFDLGLTPAKDPLHRSLRASDRELGDPKWGRTYPKPKSVMMVSVLYEGPADEDKEDGVFGDPQYDPIPGSVIVLALSPLQTKTIGDEAKSGLKYEPDFSFTNGVWTLFWDNPTPNDPSKWELSMERDLTQPPLSLEPTPIDCRELIHRIRNQSWVEFFGDKAAYEDAFDSATDDDVASFEAVASVETQAVDGEQNPWRRRGPAMVRGLLRKHKVDFDPRCSNDEVWDLAWKHLPAELAG